MIKGAPLGPGLGLIFEKNINLPDWGQGLKDFQILHGLDASGAWGQAVDHEPAKLSHI
jgi:hypothetical protein